MNLIKVYVYLPLFLQFNLPHIQEPIIMLFACQVIESAKHAHCTIQTSRNILLKYFIKTSQSIKLLHYNDQQAYHCIIHQKRFQDVGLLFFCAWLCLGLFLGLGKRQLWIHLRMILKLAIWTCQSNRSIILSNLIEDYPFFTSIVPMSRTLNKIGLTEGGNRWQDFLCLLSHLNQ